MKQQLLSNLSAQCPWRDTVLWFDTIDSTNTCAKTLAAAGAPHGTVLVAGTQTAGRGRMGRSFSSPPDKGAYLSVILRPDCAPEALMHLTCAAAAAMCDAVEAVSGLRPGIKWINDLVVQNRKLGGILTELSLVPGTRHVSWAIVGIGINCLQTPGDFPAPLGDTAISLLQASGRQIAPAVMAAAMIDALAVMDCRLLTHRDPIMTQYRQDCVTLGKDIQVIRGATVRQGKALALNPDGSLMVGYPDGTTETVSSGEVTIRGMYGYL